MNCEHNEVYEIRVVKKVGLLTLSKIRVFSQGSILLNEGCESFKTTAVTSQLKVKLV